MFSSSQDQVGLTTKEQEWLLEWGKDVFSHEDYEKILLFLYRKNTEDASQIVEEMRKLLLEQKNAAADLDTTVQKILKKQEKAEKAVDSEEQILLLKDL